MQDLVELERNQMIDLRDARIDHGLGIFGDRDFTLEHLADELLDNVLAAFLGSRLFTKTAFLDDGVQQIRLLRGFLPGTGRRYLLCFTHYASPSGLASIPSSERSLASFSVSETASRSNWSSFSLVCRVPRKSFSFVREIEQFAKRADLTGDLFRLEIVEALEAEIDFQLRRIGLFAQFILDA